MCSHTVVTDLCDMRFESTVSLSSMDNCYLFLQCHVLMETSGFEVVQTVTRVEWKSATIMHGALCVMTPGAHLMQTLHANSWDSHQQVYRHILHAYNDQAEPWLVSCAYWWCSQASNKLHNILVSCLSLCEFVSTGAIAWSRAYFGQGTGAILLDQLRCTGNETRLVNCPSNPLGIHDCSHYEDAGVTCQGMHVCLSTSIKLLCIP